MEGRTVETVLGGELFFLGQMAELLGRAPAPPQEARQILGVQ